LSEVFSDDAAAAEALAAANSAEVAPPAEAPAVEQAPVAAEQNTQVDAGTNQSSESFTNLDMSSVPEELRPIVEAKFKEFNADYTRKTQEVAPFRQTLEEAGMTAEEAQQALQFVKGLDDPDQLKALYERLSDHFDQSAQESEEVDESVDPRDAELKNVSERLARFEQAQAKSEAEATLNASIAAVKEAHPDFKEADMNRVFQLATAHMQGGKDVDQAMTSAAKEYADWRQTTINEYIQTKSSVAADGTPVLGQTTHAETPTGAFKDLDEATKAALARFGNSI